MGYNAPGDVNLRYITLADRSSGKLLNGKRIDKYVIALADSELNARNREAEGPDEHVKWVVDGGVHITLAEVDDRTIEVVYDQWAGCHGEEQGRELYIDWLTFAIRLEQHVSPSRLLGTSAFPPA
ncbi:unnamed protein product [Phytophthora lilii]|uniref:Unnamed protein product n=1 Tax=Phytophthora lilii TaxID=2077276 RepID=A0A9W6YK32_9STRA|nr:unnamed protein product [Phytophthora lilii]